ncbi:hypothetical protein D3C72_2422700 [compost metagenome]
MGARLGLLPIATKKPLQHAVQDQAREVKPMVAGITTFAKTTLLTSDAVKAAPALFGTRDSRNL